MPETNPTEKAAQDATVRAEGASPEASEPVMHPLREIRLRRRMNLEAFADLLGVSHSCIGHIERGVTKASDKVVVALSQALGISVASARQLADGTMPEELQGSGKAGAA